MTLVKPRQVSGGEHEHGHLEEFRTDPIALMRRVRSECGDVGSFRLADKHVIGVGTIPELLALDHPWIQEYFNGPRGRSAAGSYKEGVVA